MLLLFVCLSVGSIPALESNAEGTSGEQASAESALRDENPQRLEEVTGMDTDGDVFVVDEAEESAEAEEQKSSTARRMMPFALNTSPKVVNFYIKGNATTDYTEVGTGAAGYTNGAYGGDAAYLGESNGKVKFMLSGVVGEVSASEVEIVYKSDIAVVSCYVVDDGRLIHKIAHNIKTPGWATKLDNGAAPSYLKSGIEYYSYNGHYFYTDYATMLEDYQKNTRSNSVNSGNPYYNYYQYLPLRSQTSYSAAQLNSMMSSKVSTSSKMYNTGDDFVNNQNTSGVNALLMISVAGNESAWGTSSICQSKNNLFGLKAVDSSPGTSASTYASVQECIRQFADGWMSRQHLYPNSWKYFGGFLGNKGSGLNVKYASDPYWGEKAANLAYWLDKQGGNQDYNKYTIGIKDTVATSHTAVNVRNGSSTSATKLYSTGTASNYAILLQNKTAENGFYRIQSDGVLNSARTALVEGQGQYAYDNMYAYISADYITVVNQGNDITQPDVDKPEPETPEPETPDADEPEVDEPSTDTPSAQPDVDEPSTDTPSVDDSKNDSSGGKSETGSTNTDTTDADSSKEQPSDVPATSSKPSDASAENSKPTVGDQESGNTSAAAGTTEETNAETEVKDKTGIMVKGELPEGITLTVKTIDTNSQEYMNYIKPVKNNIILGVYDISLSKELTKGQKVKLVFPVAERYNGKKVVVLHYNDKGGDTSSVETYEALVSGGKVTIEVDGFSPYVLALKNTVSVAKTGDTSPIFIWGAVFAVAAVCIIIVLVKKRKR